MLPTTQDLLLEREGDLLTVWFNRPQVKNALSDTMADELLAVLQALPGERGIRFVILRGKGGAFCSGADLKMFKQVFQRAVAGDADSHTDNQTDNHTNNHTNSHTNSHTGNHTDNRAEVVAFNAGFGRLCEAIGRLPQLFVVLIEGVAMAGGLGLSCIADVVVTTADAKYALTEVSRGIPPAQIAPLVIKRIGASQARRLLLTAAGFDGIEAHRLGFAHFVVADSAALQLKAREIIDHARRGAPGAIALTKQIINATETLHGDELVQFAAERFADAMLGEEGREGMAAFADKREPAWTSPEWTAPECAAPECATPAPTSVTTTSTSTTPAQTASKTTPKGGGAP